MKQSINYQNTKDKEVIFLCTAQCEMSIQIYQWKIMKQQRGATRGELVTTWVVTKPSSFTFSV